MMPSSAGRRLRRLGYAPPRSPQPVGLLGRAGRFAAGSGKVHASPGDPHLEYRKDTT
jgi:hypothetical protein